MTMIRKVMPGQIRQLAEDEVEVILSTGVKARDGHIFEPAGADLKSYKRNPIVLWQHDPDQPIGRAEDVRVEGDKIVSTIRFAPDGISAKADEIRGLVKSGIITTMSVGMDPLESEPIDPGEPRGGQRVTRWELLECSFCSVPVDPNAVVTARSEPAAAAAAANKETSAMTTTDEKGKALIAARARMLVEKPGPVKLRGLMNVARLACALDDLGYLKECVSWEAEVEGDDSPVPAMIGEALKALGDALLAMTAEELQEMMKTGVDDEAAETVITVETRSMTEPQRAFIMAGKTLRAKLWRLGLGLARAGKAISQNTKAALEDAHGHLQRAIKHHKAMGESHGAVAEGIADMRGMVDKAKGQHEAMGEALAAAKSEPDKAGEHVARAAKAHKQIGTELDAMDAAGNTMADQHEDTGDSHRAMDRSMKSCSRCMRSMIDGASSEGDDNDSQNVQKSGGTEEDKGSSRALDADKSARARRLALLELEAAE